MQFVDKIFGIASKFGSSSYNILYNLTEMLYIHKDWL